MGKNLTIIVVPHSQSRTRNYRLSYRLLYTFLVFLSLAVVVLAGFIATYGRMLRRARQAGGLEAQNRMLIHQIAQIDSLRDELVRIQAMSIQVKKMLGLNLSEEDSILVAGLSPVVNSPAIQDMESNGEMSREEQQRMLKAVPSLWPVKGYATREFHTTGGEGSADYHPGIDIAAQRNAPVRASADGVVVTSIWDETYGYLIVIDHGFGIYTLYGHNERNLVKEGDRVTRGQTIAFLGSTGKSTAPHLHFEVRKQGVPVNPRNYLLN